MHLSAMLKIVLRGGYSAVESFCIRAEQYINIMF